MSHPKKRRFFSGSLSSNVPRASAVAVPLMVPLLLSCVSAPTVRGGPISWELIGGRWYEAGGFVERDMWMVGETLVEARPERVDSTLDLSGGWVVPPFGDAHTHNLDGTFQLADMREAYRDEGTFYIQVLTNTTRGAAAVRDTFATPGTLDVRYANAGFTSTLGHPFLAYEPRAIGIFTAEARAAREEELCRSRAMLGEAYWFIDDRADLDAVWPRWLEGDPEVLKIFVLHSERDSGGPPCGERMGHRGLRPELVPDIVERAHAAGLRVWAHVETVHDVEVVLRAGVDGLAHLPGYQMGPEEPRALYEIPQAVARLARGREVFVTPTVALASVIRDGAAAERIRDLHRRNIRRLRKEGVRIVVGSDYYGRTARQELEALRSLGLWSDAELLEMWAVTTPRAIFPDRQLGALSAGREASFLVLACDPLAEWSCTSRIRTRVKDGLRIE